MNHLTPSMVCSLGAWKWMSWNLYLSPSCLTELHSLSTSIYSVQQLRTRQLKTTSWKITQLKITRQFERARIGYLGYLGTRTSTAWAAKGSLRAHLPQLPHPSTAEWHSRPFSCAGTSKPSSACLERKSWSSAQQEIDISQSYKPSSAGDSSSPSTLVRLVRSHCS